MIENGDPPVNPIHDLCRGYVILGYSIDCGEEGRSAGLDTDGQYCLRLSLKWKNSNLGNAEPFYLGPTRRDANRHAPRYSEEEVNLDTWVEGDGNQAGDNRADDTQDIADQQAAVVEQAERDGIIPPGVVEISTDGGPRGNCHAQVKIWCPEKVDVGAHSWGKYSFHFFSCGMPQDIVVEPAPEPAFVGTGDWRGPVTPGKEPRVLPPGGGGDPPGLPMDPFLDREFDKGEPPADPIPADPERGRRLRRDTLRRRGEPKARKSRTAHGWGAVLPWSPRDSAAQNGVVVMLVGGRAAINPQFPGGVDIDRCNAIYLDGRGSASELCQGLFRAAIRLGLAARFLGDRLEIARGGAFPPGGVFGLVFKGGPLDWFHLQVSHVKIDESQAGAVGGFGNQGCCWGSSCSCSEPPVVDGWSQSLPSSQWDSIGLRSIVASTAVSPLLQDSGRQVPSRWLGMS